MAHVQQRPKHRTSLPAGGQTALHQGKRKGNPRCQRCVPRGVSGLLSPWASGLHMVPRPHWRDLSCSSCTPGMCVSPFVENWGCKARGKASDSLLLSSPAQIQSPKSLALSLTALGDCVFRIFFFTVTLHEPGPKSVRQESSGMWESKAESSRAGTDSLAMHTQPLGAPSPRDVFTHPPSMQGHGEGPVRFWEADRMEGTRCIYTPVR